MTTRITQPLRDEHKELLLEIDFLGKAGDLVGAVSQEELRPAVERAYEFLAYHLVPHAQAEEQALYPVVARAMNAPEATQTMSQDHVAVVNLTRELGELRKNLGAEQYPALRRVLYGLYTLVGVHFHKEEEVYLPLLDARLSAAQASEMFEAMERAAGEAKKQARAQS